MRRAQQAELSARYGDGGTPEPPAEHVVVTLLLALDGVPVGCGSLRDLGAEPEHGPGTGEVKRVYVAPSARGRGLARTLVHALEDRAAALGWTRLVLEAGLQQPEAIGLYLSLGYAPVERYGEWADVADSRCFAKAVGSGARGPAPRSPAPAGTLRVAVVPYADPDAAALRDAMDAESLLAYPEVEAAVATRGRFGAVDAALGSAVLVTVLARLDGRPVGCASLGRLHGSGGPAGPAGPAGLDAATTGELRRVFVHPDVRRAGVAAALVRALEAEARALGLRDLVLETGIRQPAALALYRSLGYRPVLPFGRWQGDALGLYLGRTLAV
ncbi:GNAT family N-acetyltransferase [Cellulomonas hominis]|uniref:GNAT family N-acetyltransferase n=1 Tax=Cellulomonas hominis TaxID=156981 RepID=UPI0023EAC95D|nr:GNAT family N-acetyltransferase [Cellulomonas hominis]